MTLVRIFEAPSGGISTSMLTAKQIQDFLKLQPLPVEGGYFVESYRSKFTLVQPSLPPGYPGERVLSTAIYYMLTPGTFSAMHRLKGDEVYHFYLGDPVEMFMLKPDGAAEAVLLGHDILAGMRLQHAVPAGTWQGTRLAPGGKFALMGTTMAPGFDSQDFELGKRDDLSARYPNYAPLIAFLTR
ncbi:MAG: cupin domain-containing protein [Candidatus Acidiferrales bacterium]